MDMIMVCTAMRLANGECLERPTNSRRQMHRRLELDGMVCGA